MSVKKPTQEMEQTISDAIELMGIEDRFHKALQIKNLAKKEAALAQLLGLLGLKEVLALQDQDPEALAHNIRSINKRIRLLKRHFGNQTVQVRPGQKVWDRFKNRKGLIVKVSTFGTTHLRMGPAGETVSSARILNPRGERFVPIPEGEK